MKELNKNLMALTSSILALGLKDACTPMGAIDKKLVKMSAIIGFIVKPYEQLVGGEDGELRHYGQTFGITSTEVVGGSCPTNFFGYLMPNGAVECYGVLFDSVDDAQAYLSEGGYSC